MLKVKENYVVSIVDFIISVFCVVLGIISVIGAVLTSSDPNVFYVRIYIAIAITFFVLAYFAFKGAKENYNDYQSDLESLKFDYYNLKADIKDIFGELHKSMEYADVKIEIRKENLKQIKEVLRDFYGEYNEIGTTNNYFKKLCDDCLSTISRIDNYTKDVLKYIEDWGGSKND